MDQFRSRGFVGDDSLQLDFVGSDVLTIQGEISCRGMIVIRVQKDLAVLEGEGWEAEVQTYQYRYNAFVRGKHNILRYDNTHKYPGHSDTHHKHVYDVNTGKQLPGSPQFVGHGNWPTLGEVIGEVEHWYWEHSTSLEKPDDFPKLDVRS